MLGKASLPACPRRNEGPTRKGTIHGCYPGLRCQITTEAKLDPVPLGCCEPKRISSSRDQ